MSLRINTNIAALNAHRQLTGTDNQLSKSLERLSSGLRINRAADDASGLAIADGLRAQANGLTQAIRNGNDGIALVQVADGSLEESLNIVQTIRSKALQAASDGQNDSTRAFIQADIDRLLEAMNNIAQNTSFNGQNILDGSYENKKFQVGAFSGETISVSVGSALVDDLGAVSRVQSDMTLNTATGIANEPTLGTDVVSGNDGMAFVSGLFKINNVDITQEINAKDTMLDAKSVAEAVTEATGLVAYATTEKTGGTVAAGTVAGDSTDFIKINGVDIGRVVTVAGDADGALVNAINNVSEETGVRAELDNGKVKLIADDGRNIALDLGGTGATTSAHTDNGMTEAGVANTGFAAAATSVQTVTAGQLIINGVDMEGTYGSGAAGTAAAELLTAVQNIEGFETATIAADGALTLTLNTGADMNLAGSDVGSFFTAALLQNDSVHGQVNILTSETVTVSSDITDGAENFGFDEVTYAPETEGSLSEINVTNRASAEAAIVFADAALKALGEVRADLGSVQNQMESTVRNISVTRVNVQAAESSIRDVDFAEESSIFAKFQILAQSGSFALAQSNAVQQNVLSLLQ